MKKLNATDSRLTELRNTTRTISLMFVLIITVAVAPALANEVPSKDLQLFYQQNCSGCHGLDGAAISPDGKKLSGQDLTDQSWQQSTSDEKMVKVILKGKFFGMAMPKFKNDLSKDEAQLMVTDIIRQSAKGKVIEPEVTGANGG